MYSIKTSSSLRGEILVSGAIWRAIDQGRYLILKFGQLTTKLEVRPRAGLDDNEIILPEQLTEKIAIPDLPYESRLEGSTLRIGPVIGFYPDPRFFRQPDALLPRFSQYDRIRGLIFVFRSRTVNIADLTISGFYYDPKTGGFIEGIFPYPDAIFSRTRINRRVFRSLSRYVPKKNLFNRPRNVDKRQFWKLLSTSSSIRKHLPPTRVYKSAGQVVLLLKRWGSLYLKPWNLSRGRGIYRLSTNGQGYLFTDRYGNSSVVDNKQDLKKTLVKALRRKYIAQKEIVARRGKRKVDFRAYLQKDGTRNWRFTAMETKVTKPGGIISNSSMRERILPGMDGLLELCKMNRHQAKQKLSEIENLCKGALKVLEQNGMVLGDAAIDFIIDNNDKIWLLEVQLNYAAEKVADWREDETRFLPYVLPTPFAYAKALARFD